jgi:hypothetical protein
MGQLALPEHPAPPHHSTRRTAVETIKVKHAEAENGQIEVDRNLGETLQEAIDMFGEEHVLNLFRVAAKLRIGQAMRSALKGGASAAEAAEVAVTWMPAGKPTKSAALKRIEKALQSGRITHEEIEEMLSSLNDEEAT